MDNQCTLESFSTRVSPAGPWAHTIRACWLQLKTKAESICTSGPQTLELSPSELEIYKQLKTHRFKLTFG